MPVGSNAEIGKVLGDDPTNGLFVRPALLPIPAPTIYCESAEKGL
jgi:hypothetical protein